MPTTSKPPTYLLCTIIIFVSVQLIGAINVEAGEKATIVDLPPLTYHIQRSGQASVEFNEQRVYGNGFPLAQAAVNWKTEIDEMPMTHQPVRHQNN